MLFIYFIIKSNKKEEEEYDNLNLIYKHFFKKWGKNFNFWGRKMNC